MSEPALVSVVLIVKDGARFLRQALASVDAQSYRPVELLVVDGGSTDATREIAGAWPGARVIAQRGSGIAAAYNTGIEEASGEFVAFLSHDDLWLPDKLAVQVGYLQDHREVEYTVGHLAYFLEPGCERPSHFRPELLEGSHVGRVMETLVARRALFERVGGFDPAYRIANDVDWFVRVQDLGVGGAVLPDLLLRKRVHEANTSSNERVNTPELLALLRRSLARRRLPGWAGS